MIKLHFYQIIEYLSIYCLPFARLAGVISSMVILGTRTIPNRIKLLLAIILTAVMVPSLPQTAVVDLFSFTTLMHVAIQSLIGIALGFVTRIVFETFVIAGQVVAMQTGLGFASLIDRSTGVNVPALGQMFVMMATLIFLSIDGHLKVIHIVYLSFTSLPVEDSLAFFPQIDRMLYWASQMFIAAFMMVISAITALLVMNLSLGIMTRAAPQLNIFAVGFPIMTVTGMTIIWILLKSFLPHFLNQMERGNQLMCELVFLQC